MPFRKLLLAVAAAATAVMPSSSGAAAFLFWYPPDFAGPPVRGDEPGIGLPLPGASDAELKAHLLWNMRAGLNVAALQCQFAPALATVRNYNGMLSQHSGELTTAYSALTKYFKRTGGKTWQTALDQYTTRTYNGFSTLHAQLGFCEAAGSIGRDVLDQPRGQLHVTAQNRMREFRNSLVPVADRLFSMKPLPSRQQLPSLAQECWNGDGEMKKKCWGLPLS